MVSSWIQSKKKTKLPLTLKTENYAFDTFKKHLKVFLYCWILYTKKKFYILIYNMYVQFPEIPELCVQCFSIL